VCGVLRGAGLAEGPSDVGVIAPYRAQVSLLEDLLEEASLSNVTVGTVHRFQGAERDTIILDLTESEPHTLSSFLAGTSLRDAGSRLLNVALSRAQVRLVIVADLSYLRAQLSERHLLTGILADIEQRGGIVDAREVLPDAITPSTPSVDDRSILQRFDGETFLAGITTDMREARSSIVIGSPFLGQRSSHVFATVLQPATARGVRVEVITSAATNQSERDEVELSARILESSGITVRREGSMVPCGAVVDNEIVWLGATPPLRSVEASDICMARTVSGVAALSLVRDMERGAPSYEGAVQQVANS
jgi:hypothetical protein